jgi:hypothetical protein
MWCILPATFFSFLLVSIRTNAILLFSHKLFKLSFSDGSFIHSVAAYRMPRLAIWQEVTEGLNRRQDANTYSDVGRPVYDLN